MPKTRTFDSKACEVRRHPGKDILLPEGMEYKEGATWMIEAAEQEDTVVQHRADIACHPLDGLVQFWDAIREMYGIVKQMPTPGFFGAEPPRTWRIPVGPNEDAVVPVGMIRLPNVDNGVVSVAPRTFDPIGVVVSAKVKRKHVHVIDELVSAMQLRLAEHSIYKGTAFRLPLDWMESEDREFDVQRDSPQFLRLGDAPPLILSRSRQRTLDATLFLPIADPGSLLKYNIPVGRGVLCYGPPGCGKTLTAFHTAEAATSQGWTFVLIDRPEDIAKALKMVELFTPAVLFIEDVERVFTSERTDLQNRILNALDGVATKNKQIIVVATTNNVEKMGPVALRPGRMDTVIELPFPDEEVVEHLLRYYAGDTISIAEDLSTISQMLGVDEKTGEGYAPAVAREIVNRAIAMVLADERGDPPGGVSLKEQDLIDAYDSMANHLRLLGTASLPMAQVSSSLVSEAVV